MKFGKLRLTENDQVNIFQSPCFIEDVIFSASESIQKKNMVTANCMLHKNGLI